MNFNCHILSKNILSCTYYIVTPPRLGVTKEMMSRGPQVEDMEC
jgi:hypothetical protein